ncbi:MAG: hypothetical protein PHD33_06110 [Atribacterota bacterium]|jgi:hypothetical protein|nr:hypothetical protein [Atribacterota bacterium]
MKEEIKQVLDMLKEGKITNEEAVGLIEALKSTEKDGIEQTKPIIGKQKRFFKINVTKDGKPKVNIKVPFSLVKWGVNIANKMGKDTVKIGGEEIPFDMEELNNAMNDPEFSGKICDVYDEEKNEHVEIEIV